MPTRDWKDFDAKLQLVKQRLKDSNVRASLQRKGASLYVRATVPPKPGSEKTEPFQQDIALDLKANSQALPRAEAEARKIGAAIDLKEFDWTHYMRTHSPVERRTVGEWKAALEVAYFARRKRTPQSETTFKGHYHNYLKRLPQNQPLTKAVLERAIRATVPDSYTRSAMCFAGKALGEFALLDVSFIDKKLRGTYSSQRPAPRNLPSDETIVAWFAKIPNPAWRWVYGMLATYGLRPHEIFHLDTQDLEQGDDVLKVLEGTKTGYREVRPLHPEWVDQLGLRQKQLPKVTVTGKTNQVLGGRVSQAFHLYKVPFPPYHLRHCYAVRCLRFGIPVPIAARWMGHQVAIHTQTYQAWLSKAIEREAFQHSLQNPHRPQPPRMMPLDPKVSDSKQAASEKGTP